jgi:ubiquinone/menaquinone biosynthesis C-methylase UbiE
MRRGVVLLLAATVAAAAVAAAASRRRRDDARHPSHALRRVQTLYDHGAARYDRAMDVLDRVLFDAGRRWAAEQARGSVLEIAAGTGRTSVHVRRDTPVTVQDVSARMLARARDRAATAGRSVTVTVGDAQQLAFRDGSFDTVLCTLGLCTIPDDRRAIAEAWRVLRPGGQAVLLEHVRSSIPAVQWIQRLLDPFACLLAGDHLLRDPAPVLAEAGFEIVRVQRRAWGMVEQLVARKRTRREVTDAPAGLEPARRRP